jgi:protein TonB
MLVCSHSVNPRFALACLWVAGVALGGTGCATTTRATTPTQPVSAPAPEPIAEPPPAPAPAPVAKAEKPKAVKRAAPRPASSPEVKPEPRVAMSARTQEPRRPQMDGTTAALGSSAPVPFEPAGMTRPQRVSGRDPQLTAEARAERVRGTALVRCVVTREGQVTNCRLLNGLPYMEQELLEAVSTWRVTPVMAQGRPIDVDYTFVVRIPMR